MCLAALAAAAAWLHAGLWALAILPAAIWLWVIWFFRDPQRDTPAEAGLMVSPADGRVADITPLGAENPLGEPAVRVGVFMSLFNVHVNRSPLAGEVLSVEHRRGEYLDARDPSAAERNESTTIVVRARTGPAAGQKAVVRQIAGLVARRIVTDIQPGQAIERGQRIGMIKFGSRLELIVPADWQDCIAVRCGEVVAAGRTVLLRLESEDDDSE